MSTNKGGRPKIVVTQEMRNVVAVLAGFMEPADIGVVVGMSERSVYSKFKKELKNATPKIKALCLSTVVQNVRKGGSIGQRAAEFLLYTRFGWSKYAPPPVTNPDDKQEPIGKKAQLEQDAQPGNEPEEWGKLLQ